MNRPASRAVAIGVAAAMACATLVAVPHMAQAQPEAQTNAKKDVQVIAFQQTWNTVAKECTSTYGPEDVAYVEVSPPQESIQGTQWWTSYQPVSYKLDSKLGTEAEFKNMIKQCNAVGVDIIADVVLNQTTGADVADGKQTGVAGTEYNGSTGDYPGFATEQYPEGITASDFHSCSKNISNYANQQEVQECRLSSMWDFDSESEKVQDIQSDYLAALWNAGVRGFRMDAVKHIHTDSMKAIKEKFAKKIGVNADSIYWIQEVIGNSSEATGIQPSNYVQNGTVTEFGFKSEMNQTFKDKIANLKGLNERLSKDLASEDANVFVANWDTARNEGALTYKDGAKYQLANAFMLAYDYGTPRLLSDYKWDENDNGAPGATATSVPDVNMDEVCSTNSSDWNCEQRWTSTRGMIAFRNYVNGTKVADWQDDGGDNIAFSRGDKGFIAINNGKTDKDASYTTSLADGEYCNVYATMDCSQTVSVKNGKVETTVPAHSAIALYAGATKDSHPASSVANDPSDPDVNQEGDETLPDDRSVTIYYKPADSGWKSPKVHYGLGDDWNQPEADMTLDEQGYYRATIDTRGKKIDFVFHDTGTDQWENPKGGGNYHANAGITHVGVADQAATVGNPESVNGQTRLVVHYKPASDSDNRGVYVWGTDAGGSSLSAVNHPFTGADCWGKVATLTFGGKFDKFGFIVTTADWNKYGGDRSATVNADGKAVDVKNIKTDGTKVLITTAKDLDVRGKYTVEVKGFGSQDAIAGSVVRTDAFDKKYAYDGDDLGATYTSAKTGFKVWAPTATKVELVTYQSDDVNAEVDKTIDMASEDKGVWSALVKNLASGTAYSYKLTFADGTVNVSADPYATAAVANGERSVVLSSEDMGSAGDRMPEFGKTTDATIAEMNIRDFSINPNSGISADKRGKYLGVVESGTKTANGATSGLDYLKQLGVSHVQIMPMYDYGSVDETGDLSYNAQGAQNWGYDPENYNVPEGSYSSDPSDPASRVTEMKQMVKGLHENDIRVIMDVVYNHVYNAANHSFNKTVPGYYFRYDDNGSLVNNSGCGNDTASERKMMRKYIVDSVTYWAKNYNVDGFRFDLMGLIDTETMKEVRAALDEIDPSIIILGEGWDMNTTMDEGEMTIQPNAYQVASDGTNNGIAFFNDSVRDGLKGSVFSDTDTGFVSGKADQESLIAHNVLGCQYDENATTTCWNGNAQDHYADAGQVVNYAEIHDNMTLYDKLRKSVPTDDDATTVARAKLADSVVYLSEGIPAIQLGQEFLRTKGGDGNSYNTGDAVNAIDWDRTTQYADSVDYVKGLIKLRKQINALRLTDYNDINANVTMLKSADGVVAYQAEQSDGTYVVIFNANADKTAIEGLANGSYQVLAADGKVYSDDAIANVDLAEGASYEAGALSATVLKLDSSTKPDTDSAPVIKGLVASDSVTLGSKFDPMSGVSAWDEVDGDLTDKITVEGSVDTSKEGEYTLVYSVTNSRGKTATFTRTVTVRKPAVQPASDKKSDAVQSPNTGSAITGFALAAVALAIASVFAFAASRRKED